MRSAFVSSTTLPCIRSVIMVAALATSCGGAPPAAPAAKADPSSSPPAATAIATTIASSAYAVPAAPQWERVEYAPGISATFPVKPERIGGSDRAPAYSTRGLTDISYLMMCFDTSDMSEQKVRENYEGLIQGKASEKPISLEKIVDREGERETIVVMLVKREDGNVFVSHDRVIMKGKRVCGFSVLVTQGLDRSQDVSRFFAGIEMK